MLKTFSLRRNTNVTVMLIDDDEKLLESLCKYLESKEFKVLTAHSSETGLSVLEKIIPDILIVDIMMPQKSGYDFIISIKTSKRLRAIPFIFLTAKGMTQDRIKGYRLGCRAYITKPFDPEELISLIKNNVSQNKNINNIRNITTEIRRIRIIIENKNMIHITFTSREKSILVHIINGKTNKDIAKNIKIGIRNVEKYVTRLLDKTHSKNRTELVKFAYKFYKEIRANDGNRTRE
jgi:DNA-binding NarL/FixJ family response regulator